MDLGNFLIPSIDLKEGKVVRLYKGEFNKLKVYSSSPSSVAAVFEDSGFKRIHVVDLDGAEKGRLRNLFHIRQIRKVYKGILQVGGGIRSYEVARSLFEEGADFVVIGTLAVKNPSEFEKILSDFPKKVVLAVDCRNGKVSVRGWKELSSYTPKELASTYDHKSLWGYLYTVIEKDGSLEGISVEPYVELKKHISKPLLASGGVSSLEDIRRLAGIVEGVVVGKALYEGRIPLVKRLTS